MSLGIVTQHWVVLYRGWDLNAVASTKFARNNNTGGLFV
jgi:hypothetical protein